MKAAITLGPGFTLPDDAVTQTYGLLGKRGVGKTETAVVLAEELLDRGHQVVIIDPVGVWWGLRASADGTKGGGYPVLIMGGEHGDIPLEANAGKLVADFVVSKGASVVLDVGNFGKAEQGRFVADFLERLYQKNRAPLQVIIDEADAFAPQRMNPGVLRTFGAVDTAVRRGRARGLGITLITQRSAALNKDVLTQIEVLIAFRTIAPQDRAAIEAWVEVHADRPQAKDMISTLAVLKVGEAWVWSPSWLERLSRVQVRRRRTFDSSATPKAGQKRITPKSVTPVDVEQFRTELASLVQRADEEDPKRLRARIALLERELKAKPAELPRTIEIPVEVSILTPTARQLLETVGTEMAAFNAHIMTMLKAPSAFPPMTEEGRSRDAAVSRTVSPAPAPSVHTAPRGAARRPAAGSGDPAVGNGGLRRMLIALAQRPSGLNRQQLGVRAGMSSRSGTFSTYLGKARQSDWVTGRDTLYITADGIDALGSYEPLPEGRELLQYWLSELGQSGAARMLRVLADAHPRAMTNEALGDAAEISHKSGTFSTYLGKLRKLELVEGRGELMASAELFDGGAR